MHMVVLEWSVRVLLPPLPSLSRPPLFYHSTLSAFEQEDIRI